MMNRREFLKLSLASLFGLAFPPVRRMASWAQDVPKPILLGRTVSSLRYYDKPSLSGVELGFYNTDTVIKIFETKLGDPEPKYNPLWLRTEHGWVHSALVQFVRDEPATPVLNVPAQGFLGEVCVPWTQAWTNSQGKLKRSYRYYYGTTHWITQASTDSFGNPWYQIVDDLVGGYHYVDATHIRQVLADEVTPIHPTIQDKYVLIKLADQRLYAYENGRVILTARCSTGTFAGDTPTGEFRVERKQPSRHMAADEERGNGFDLPGVPWVSFISWTGVSIHGTYWHNEYGVPRSHGCINLTPSAAKWIYRWTAPHVPVEEDYVETKDGTRVVVE
jgi:lipoprotein-anchoring transpeptidase ErfK/SrfK